MQHVLDEFWLFSGATRGPWFQLGIDLFNVSIWIGGCGMLIIVSRLCFDFQKRCSGRLFRAWKVNEAIQKSAFGHTWFLSLSKVNEIILKKREKRHVGL